MRRARRVLRRHLVRASVRVAVLMAGDLVALVVVRTLLHGIRDLGWFAPGLAFFIEPLIPQQVLQIAPFTSAVLLGLVILDNYGASDRRRDGARLFAGATLGVALPFWSYLWSNFTLLAVPGFVLLALATSVSLILERHLIDATVRKLWPVAPGAARALVIGRPQELETAFVHPALADTREFAVAGGLDPAEFAAGPGPVRVHRLCREIRRCRADTVVVAGALDDDAFGTVIEGASVAGCQLYALTRMLRVGGVEPHMVWLRGAPLVMLNRPTLLGRQLLAKRTLDLLCSGLGLAILSPVLVLIAAAVSLSSPGPVFFRQRRVGLGGGTFQINKFRTMVADAEARRADLGGQSVYKDERLFKVKNDPRITSLGAYLRRTSLDELPQLWNVLKGEMSLVGPRPPLPSEVELYEEHHYARFDVKPGMTGPWQVNGRNSITDFEQVIRLEQAYIRDWSIWKDLAILIKTIPVVFSMRGAH